MKKFIIYTISMAFILCCITSHVMCADVSSSKISGFVKTADGGYPLEGATIKYRGPSPEFSGSLKTDANGYYIFGGIDGQYIINACADNYITEEKTIIIPPAAENVDFELVLEISINPLNIGEEICKGESEEFLRNVNLVVSNNSDAAIDYSIDFTDTTLAASDIQDEFGYIWTDSDEVEGPDFTWNDISSTGKSLDTISEANDTYQEQTISFLFPFYGYDYSSIFISTNGYITLGDGDKRNYNYELPSVNAPPNLIAPFFDDLTTYEIGDIYFQDFSDKVVVQYNSVKHYSGDGAYTFQTVLHRDGRITFYYKSLTGLVTSATVGIQNKYQDDGLTVIHNAEYLKDSLAVEFRLPSKWISFTPSSGTFYPNESAEISIELDASFLDIGKYFGDINISHNASFTFTPFTIPLTLYVVLICDFVEVPSPEAPTIQKAIELVAEGGMVSNKL